MSEVKTADDLMSFNHLWHKSQDRSHISSRATELNANNFLKS